MKVSLMMLVLSLVTVQANASKIRYELESQTEISDPSPLAKTIDVEFGTCANGFKISMSEQNYQSHLEFCPDSTEQNSEVADYDKVCVGYRLDLIDQYECIGFIRKVPYVTRETSVFKNDQYVKQTSMIKKKTTTFFFEEKAKFSRDGNTLVIERSVMRSAGQKPSNSTAVYKKSN